MNDPTTTSRLQRVTRCTCGAWTWLTSHQLTTGRHPCTHIPPPPPNQGVA